jgi:hypothetical protein
MSDNALFDTEAVSGEYPDDPKTIGFVTPYPSDKGHTTGHAGDGGSEDRAHYDEKSGAASYRQRVTLAELAAFGLHGLTWKELAERNGWHHGQASGVLSVLHKEGRIACLKERRANCAVYVTPDNVDHRETVEHRGTRAAEDRAAIQRVRDLLDHYPHYADTLRASLVREALEGKP